MLVTLAPPEKQALIYSFFGFLVGAATAAVQVAIAVSLSPVTDWKTWAISSGAGILAAGIAASLPYLKAVLPPPPQA